MFCFLFFLAIAVPASYATQTYSPPVIPNVAASCNFVDICMKLAVNCSDMPVAHTYCQLLGWKKAVSASSKLWPQGSGVCMRPLQDQTTFCNTADVVCGRMETIVCTNGQCPEFSGVHFSVTYNPPDREVNGTATISCDPGYELLTGPAGPAVRTCGPNELWNPVDSPFLGYPACTDINECASNPCQNNGTCLNQINKFTCECAGGFYGTFCEQSCNVDWTAWSPCTRSCDYGVQRRWRMSLNRADPSPCDPSTRVNQYRPCNTDACFSYASADSSACSNIHGFYTNNACFYTVQSTEPLAWKDSFGLCSSTGGFPGHIHDSGELNEAIQGWLMQTKLGLNFWIPLRQSLHGTEGMTAEWMDDAVKASSVAWISMDQEVTAANPELCGAIKTTNQSFAGDNFLNFTLLPCSQNIAGMHVLCTKRTPFADFVTMRGQYLRMNNGTVPATTTEINDWMCGLRCKQQYPCLGYNFQSTTGACQLVTAKVGMPETVEWGGVAKSVFTIVSKPKWNFYNRRY